MKSLNTKRKHIHKMIAGALYNFMGHLTTGKEDFPVGQHSDVVPLLEAFKKWADDRSLDTDDPYADWEKKI